MISNEQILELAKDFLEEWEADEDGRTWMEFSGTAEKIIQFAQAMYEKGYEKGDENGWESREQAEYFNRSSYPTGLVGDPQ